MGGGVTLVNAYVALKNQLKDTNVDKQKGIKVVLDEMCIRDRNCLPRLIIQCSSWFIT